MSQQRNGSGYMYWQNRKRHRRHGVTQKREREREKKKFSHAKFKSGDPAHRHRTHTKKNNNNKLTVQRCVHVCAETRDRQIQQNQRTLCVSHTYNKTYKLN